MFIFWIEKKQTTPGPDVLIDCPACRSSGVATTADQWLQNWYLGFIPVPSSRWTNVFCPNCKNTLHSKVKAVELSVLPPEKVAAAISHRASFLQSFLAVAALIVAIFPAVGFGMALIALLANWKYRGWTKKVSYVALAVSVIPTALMIIALATEPAR
jgi:hypothetical protein